MGQRVAKPNRSEPRGFGKPAPGIPLSTTREALRQSRVFQNQHADAGGTELSGWTQMQSLPRLQANMMLAENNDATVSNVSMRDLKQKCGAQECEATVELNVIYDNNAHGGQGLTQEEKDRFSKRILYNAQKEYRNAQIGFNVRYSPGEMFEDGEGNLNIRSPQRSGINVVVSDTLPSKLRGSGPGKGASFISKGYAVTTIGLGDADDNILAHELSHHFLGDTQKPASNVFSGYTRNAVGDIINDFTRWQVRTFGVQRYDKGTGGLKSVNPFLTEAKKFRRPR